MIQCPKCKADSRVYATREDKERRTYRRFRRCETCKHQWVTIEVEDVDQPIGFITPKARAAMKKSGTLNIPEMQQRRLADRMKIPVGDVDIYKGFRAHGAPPQKAAEMVRRLNDKA